MSTILLKNIYKEGELDKDSTCKEYLQVAHEGSNALKFAAMRAKGVQAVVYSAYITPDFKVAVALHNKQYPGLEPKTMRTIHDRLQKLNQIAISQMTVMESIGENKLLK